MGGDWDSVRERMRTKGVRYVNRAVEGAQAEGFSPADVLAMCDEPGITADSLAKRLINGGSLELAGRKTQEKRPKTADEIAESVRWSMRGHDPAEIDDAVRDALGSAGYTFENERHSSAR